MIHFGFGLMALCGVALLALEVYWAYEWWGGVGLVIALFGSPVLSAVFPFLYLFKEGFSATYFALWLGAALGVGLAVLGANRNEGKRRRD